MKRLLSSEHLSVDGILIEAWASMESFKPGKRSNETHVWIKTVSGQRKARFRGVARVGLAFTFAAAAYNLVRLPKLLAEAG